MNFSVLFSIVFVTMTPVNASYERPGMIFSVLYYAIKIKIFAWTPYYKGMFLIPRKIVKKTLVIDISF